MNYKKFSYKILSETKACFCFEIAFFSAKTCYTHVQVFIALFNQNFLIGIDIEYATIIPWKFVNSRVK